MPHNRWSGNYCCRPSERNENYAVKLPIKPINDAKPIGCGCSLTVYCCLERLFEWNAHFRKLIDLSPQVISISFCNSFSRRRLNGVQVAPQRCFFQLYARLQDRKAADVQFPLTACVNFQITVDDQLVNLLMCVLIVRQMSPRSLKLSLNYFNDLLVF